MKQLSDDMTNTHGCDMLQSVCVGKTYGIFVTTKLLYLKREILFLTK